MKRGDQLRRLREAPLDVLILGGGINGAGIARDLALRSEQAGAGLRIGLIEQRQFSSGTSGKNSQLIHGGLRYLKGLEFGLVREALHERATLLEMAPHLVEPLEFLIPFESWFSRWYYGAGLWIYDLLAGERNLGRRRALSGEELGRIEPGLAPDRFVAGAVFFDARVHSARFVLENVADAVRHGAMAVNYSRAEGISGRAATVADTLSGETFEVRARKLVDATGPWSRQPGLRLVRGSHLVLPRLNRSDRAIAYFEPGGRILFVIPWGSGRRFSLVGTTDIDHAGGPGQVRISEEEVRYLLALVRRLFPAAAGMEPISAFSSLRPLVGDASASATAVSRGHRIWNTPDGILHIAGGKYTTYRAMSEEAAGAVCREIAPVLAGLHPTATTPLGGHTRERIGELRASAGRLAAQHDLEEAEVEEIIREYGAETPALLSLLADSTGLTRLERARIRYAVEREMAQRLDDLLYVSTYWGYERQWTEDGLRPYAQAMAEDLGWDERRMEQEIAGTLSP
ncbi:MAG: glycerol-3-phosphate dehydrogenase/oxidase [Acidobacteria bacterium]|nr:glycerol-3-phosphate dehydrogenase/oxidase [Acidobacteriota bacterium]